MSLAGTDSARSDAAGSPLTGEPAFLAVGKLRHAHGVHGEILMEILTDFPERIQPGTIFYLEAEVHQLRLTRCRRHAEGLLVTFAGYSTPEQVSQLRNQILYVRSDDRPSLPEGEYYHHQLINLEVIRDTGIPIGRVTGILETGASDVLVVRPEAGSEILIPFVAAFVQGIDLTRREITVHLIPGMLAEED